jgi:hypothetical protein
MVRMNCKQNPGKGEGKVRIVMVDELISLRRYMVDHTFLPTPHLMHIPKIFSRL